MLPSDRIDAIDALRGLALFGVIAINLVFEFRVSIFEQFLREPITTSPFDRGVEHFLTVAIDMKAFSLFSMLFGVGLAIQFERLAGNHSRPILLVRRLIVLLLLGLVHLILIWNGDILTEYALAGLVVLPFLFGPRWLLAAGGLLSLAFYLTVPPLVSLPDAAVMRDLVAEAHRIYAQGGFSDVQAFRIRELFGIFPLRVSVFPRTIALFLFGAFFWRIGILRCPTAHRPLLLVVGIVGVMVGLVMSVAGAPWLIALAPVVLASGYGATIIGLMTTSGGRAILGWAIPLGRMAFTNYVAESVVLGWVFYGYGLGLFGGIGAASALTFGIALYAVQAMFSAWWLKRHRFGPIEWVWRTLMYGVRQPMQVSDALSESRTR